ncbi:MAG: hypothetical protein IKU83_04720 [Lachnospiraceae bacterium]|nr:hypothetical protein [Lachnospiraceae bacterium]
MQDVFEKKIKSYAEIHEKLAPSKTVLDTIVGRETVKRQRKGKKKRLFFVLVAAGVLTLGAVGAATNENMVWDRVDFWLEHPDEYTIYGGKRPENAEPYREYKSDGTYVEVDLGGYYNEKGEYIVPAEEGYWVYTEEGHYNPVTGEYFYLVQDEQDE